MYPPVWGPHIWASIHLMTYVYPDKPSEERKRSIQLLLENICINLPCPLCSSHCQAFMKQYPPKIESREDLKRWAFDFHNSVNKRTGKRELSYQEAEECIQRQFFQRKDWIELKRAQEMRREDHIEIDKWKNLSIATDTTCPSESVNISTILFSICIFLLILFITIIIFKY
jgi:Rps23 Pro-64 3,4-dihydroxylase Tpa1-like proline 4-hydroxylase